MFFHIYIFGKILEYSGSLVKIKLQRFLEETVFELFPYVTKFLIILYNHKLKKATGFN